MGFDWRDGWNMVRPLGFEGVGMIGFEDVVAARTRIAPFMRHTPVIEVTAVSAPVTEADLVLKLECLQATGSFKARGATNKLLSLPEESVARGIVTASGGNHGLAVARAARIAGVNATIFVPVNVAPDKVEKLRHWGADVRIGGAHFAEANALAMLFVEETGAAYFHPFADPHVIAGQGTSGLEFHEDCPDLDVLLVAVGGGGLISGLSVAMRHLNPRLRIIGIEPEGAPTLKAALDAGKPVRLPEVTTRVATMAAQETVQGIVDIAKAHVEDVVLVSDDEMQHAASWLWFEMGIAADLSGAAAIAALETGRLSFPKGTRVGALVCGAGLPPA